MDPSKTIFINIPSYEDPEIWETICSFINNAKYPNRIFFGVANQTKAKKLHEEVLERFPNVSMHILEPGSIAGAQPCRIKSHEFYRGEDYYLNMDSHMRAIKNWDLELIDELDVINKKYGKSVLTGYVTAYDKDKDGNDIIPEVGHTTVFNMSESNVKHFYEYGIPQFCSYITELSEPVRSPYISGHFFFTTRDVIESVPYVSKILFTEEEIFMAVRFFTAGYNIFQPSKTFVYHRYGRAGRALFWDDFPEQWFPKEKESREYASYILQNHIVGEDALFDKRLLSEFEESTGINFRNRTLSESVISGKIN